MSKETAALLLSQLDTLRADEPLLWAIVRGRGKINKLGLLAGLTPTDAREQMESLVKRRVIVESEKNPGVFYLSKTHEGYPQLRKLRQLNHLVEMKWLREYPDDSSRVDVAGSTWEAWREENPTARESRVERFDSQLTLKQAQVMVAAGRAAIPGSTFRPLDLAKAQGYTAAGFSKSQLSSLARKGFTEEVVERPSTWRLTEAGVEKVKELRAKGVEPAMKPKDDLSPDDL